MKGNKKILFWFFTLTLLSISCDEDHVDSAKVNDSISNEIIEKLSGLGFYTGEVLKFKDGYLVERDIFLTEKMIDNLIESSKTATNGKVKHYRTNNIVSGHARRLLVFMDNDFNQNMQNAFDVALARYNALDLNVTFERTLNAGLSNIQILGEDIPVQPDGTITLGFSAGFPENGNPASPITLNTLVWNGVARADAIVTITHEIGHAIGFRHTDFMNRSFSCNGAAINEGSGDSGANHIPGTPTNEDPNSWMLACSNGADRPFTVNDITALRGVYPSDLGIYDLSSINDLSISLDYDGDMDDDLIFYRPGSRILYLFEFRNGAYVIRNASTNGFNNYDLSSVYDRIISFDFNGDNRDDLLFYRPGQRISFIMTSNGNGTFVNSYVSYTGFLGYDLSNTNDKLISTDYNNDGMDDVICYRPGSRIFWLYRSNGNGTFSLISNSSSGIGGYDLSNTRDLVLSLDYNGDGRDDIACYRPGNGYFYLLRSNGVGGYTQVIASNSGIAGYNLSSIYDRLIRLNIDGDIFDDIAAYRPSDRKFYVLRSNGTNFSAIISSSSGIMGYNFDNYSDKAISFDYNTDGRSDLLCYRPGHGIRWYGMSTGSNFTRTF